MGERIFVFGCPTLSMVSVSVEKENPILNFQLQQQQQKQSHAPREQGHLLSAYAPSERDIRFEPDELWYATAAAGALHAYQQCN